MNLQAQRLLRLFWVCNYDILEIMFITGFEKTAATIVTMTPEEYYDIVREKDPSQGAVLGALTGAAAGARRGAAGKKHKAALIGAAAGGATGALAGHGVGKVVRGYQTRRVHRLAKELHLKATPGKRQHEGEQ